MHLLDAKRLRHFRQRHPVPYQVRDLRVKQVRTQLAAQPRQAAGANQRAVRLVEHLTGGERPYRRLIFVTVARRPQQTSIRAAPLHQSPDREGGGRPVADACGSDGAAQQRRPFPVPARRPKPQHGLLAHAIVADKLNAAPRGQLSIGDTGHDLDAQRRRLLLQGQQGRYGRLHLVQMKDPPLLVAPRRVGKGAGSRGQGAGPHVGHPVAHAQHHVIRQPQRSGVGLCKACPHRVQLIGNHAPPLRQRQQVAANPAAQVEQQAGWSVAVKPRRMVRGHLPACRLLQCLSGEKQPLRLGKLGGGSAAQPRQRDQRPRFCGRVALAQFVEQGRQAFVR